MTSKKLAKGKDGKTTEPRAKLKIGLDRAIKDIATGRLFIAKDYTDLIHQHNN